MDFDTRMQQIRSSGGRARADALTDAERQAIARKGAAARWEKFYKANPEKRKKKRTKRGSKAA